MLIGPSLSHKIQYYLSIYPIEEKNAIFHIFLKAKSTWKLYFSRIRREALRYIIPNSPKIYSIFKVSQYRRIIISILMSFIINPFNFLPSIS